MAENKKAAIIGAGLGGLAAAIRLAVLGIEVHVFEQSPSPGGKAGYIEEDGFRFDTGPSLITMPFVIEDLFQTANERMSDYFSLERLNTLCRYFYNDGTTINAYSDKEKFASEIEDKTCDGRPELFNFLEYTKKIYDLTSDIFLLGGTGLKESLLSRKTFISLPKLFSLDVFRTMNGANSRFFKDDKTVQLFDRYATYNGSDPFKAPATLNIISHVENNIGGYFIREGIYALPKSLYKIARKKGVHFHFNSKVDEIITAGNKAAGISYKTSGQHRKIESFDIVVSNADAEFTYSTLLRNKFNNRIRKYEPSTSALVFYWGIKGIHQDLEIHNILFSRDYKTEFNDLFSKEKCPVDPTVYIYVSSKYKPDDAPEGCENWFVMINAPAVNGQDWETEIARTKAVILKKINKFLNTDVSSKIIFERVMSPLDIERNTNSTAGSIYGISSNSKTAAFMRRPNKSNLIDGLYFCGGSVHPGGGIPLVLLSAQKAVNQIIKHEKII